MAPTSDAAIVISTHRTGIPFLENLLRSFGGYSAYPMRIVVSDWVDADHGWIRPLVRSFPKLPITIDRIERNGFELGALDTTYRNTQYQELLLVGSENLIIPEITGFLTIR